MEPELTRTGAEADAGLSLIELMIVVAILSVLSVAAGFAVGRPGTREQDDARAFLAAYETQRLQAILARQPRVIAVTDRGWTPLAPDAAAEGGWRAAGDERRLRGALRAG